MAPDLILLDLMMPRMNGVELCARLAEVPAWASLPVVIVSADLEARAKVRHPSVVAILAKPIKLSRLLEVICQIAGPLRGA